MHGIPSFCFSYDDIPLVFGGDFLVVHNPYDYIAYGIYFFSVVCSTSIILGR
jgi:hypothetical protein